MRHHRGAAVKLPLGGSLHNQTRSSHSVALRELAAASGATRASASVAQVVQLPTAMITAMIAVRLDAGRRSATNCSRKEKRKQL